MTITLFELAGANPDDRFSPHCWKSRLALVFKKLAYSGEPVRFTEKEKIAFSNQPLLPVVKDGDTVINDSWAIAEYLEATYPQAPNLFAGEEGKAEAKAFNDWVDTEVAQYIRPTIVMPIFKLITQEDQEYFRTSREQKLGTTLESIEAIAPEKLKSLASSLDPVREKLATQTYLGGEQPDYKDICLMSVFLWVATVSDVELLEQGDRVNQWYQHMLAYFADTLPESVKAVA